MRAIPERTVFGIISHMETSVVPSSSEQELKSQLRFPIVVQVVGFGLTALILDGGEIFHCFVAAMLVYWVFFLLKMLPGARLGTVDHLLVRFGTLLFFACFLALRFILWRP